MHGELIRVRGLVQGVGFRPTVWRIAKAIGLVGEVLNDTEGVLIRLWGEKERIDRLCDELRSQCPPLARIDALEREPVTAPPTSDGFHIVASRRGDVQTGVVPDAATCPACRGELFDASDRRYRYPFINCTHCGPRLSILERIPYDRANTSMAPFPMCAACSAEYQDPDNRRFHAQPNACPVCGPRVWLQAPGGYRRDAAVAGSGDAIAVAGALLARSGILAVKGIGGFHLACDATNTRAVAELRRRKRRYAKPFALMARDLAVIRRYCRLGAEEAELLLAPAAPIVLLEQRGPATVAPEVAPGQSALGFMLPYSPLHHLLLADWDRPLVMTSGNRSDEPQCIDNQDAVERLSELADALLLHDRAIVNRVDDSLVRMMDGAPRVLRRARGYAPAPLRMPVGFGEAPSVLALGGELKNTFCLLARGEATLSQHLGDLEEAETARAYERTIRLYLELFQHAPETLAIDLHPNYRSTLLGKEWARRDGLRVHEVQHHHAHIASVLADNRWPAEDGAVLGIALDGLGYGPDGTFWGGELLVANYSAYRRVGLLAPTPMPGGMRAIMEPWRSAFAQLSTHLGWDWVRSHFGSLEAVRWLQGRPLAVLERMVEGGVNTPWTSSCGRLFDSVAAVLGLCRRSIGYEGQAAIELEALAHRGWPTDDAYTFEQVQQAPGVLLDPASMWCALLEDLGAGHDSGAIAARFHLGLADAFVKASIDTAASEGLDTVALSGGVFQNRILLESVACGLRASGLRVLVHQQVPANDGGLSLGQAAIAAMAGRAGSSRHGASGEDRGAAGPLNLKGCP
jgi:hydrogenase maturation protein HypF